MRTGRSTAYRRTPSWILFGRGCFLASENSKCLFAIPFAEGVNLLPETTEASDAIRYWRCIRLFFLVGNYSDLFCCKCRIANVPYKTVNLYVENKQVIHSLLRIYLTGGSVTIHLWLLCVLNINSNLLREILPEWSISVVFREFCQYCTMWLLAVCIA